MRKHNLVLIPGFAINSILTKGYVEYLSDNFNVTFIDLPGFHPDIKPLKDNSLKNYINYVNKKINELKLEEYWLYGTSFGFYIANNLNPDKRCNGIIGLMPYLNVNYLKIKPWIHLTVKLINLYKLQKWYWNSYFFDLTMNKYGSNKDAVKKTRSSMDPKAFFKLEEEILKNKQPVKFKDIPYVLSINREDKVIKADLIINKFKQNVKKLLVIEFKDIPHFPEELNKEYFVKHDHGETKKLIEFMDKC